MFQCFSCFLNAFSEAIQRLQLSRRRSHDSSQERTDLETSELLSESLATSLTWTDQTFHGFDDNDADDDDDYDDDDNGNHTATSDDGSRVLKFTNDSNHSLIWPSMSSAKEVKEFGSSDSLGAGRGIGCVVVAR